MVPPVDFEDAHHVEHLRKALWSGQAYGRAAVMVGAGFSRNADTLITDWSAPDFNALARSLWAEINLRPESEAPANLDPVEVASTYEAIFKAHALNRAIATAVLDASLLPSTLHSLLVSLPWADIYTTNWDTLLERAAAQTRERTYHVITHRDAIVGSQRARLIKLHGSLPDHPPYIVTKEHFRRYPQTHAPFVNMVQQAVMECAFCLLGFSGNDPNFVSWAGWVRDHLGDTAPSIYLVGIFDWKSRERSAIENRGFTPIDLGAVFPESEWPSLAERNKAANEWFLRNLAKGEPDPLSWPISTRRIAGEEVPSHPRLPQLCVPESPPPRTSFDTLAHALRMYPGWTTCPPTLTNLWLLCLRKYATDMRNQCLSEPQDSAVVALLTWARGVAVIGYTLDEELRDAASNMLGGLPLGHPLWFPLCLHLIKALRADGIWDEFDEWIKRAEVSARQQPASQAQLAVESAFAALNRLEFRKLKQIVASWPKLPDALDLELHRIRFLAEVGMLRDAQEALAGVRDRVRRMPDETEHNPIPRLSLEGRALRLQWQVEVFGTSHRVALFGRYRELSNWDCLVDDYLEAYERELGKAVSPPEPTTSKRFDTGSFTVHSRSSSETPLQIAERTLRSLESLGLPFRIENRTLGGKVALLAAQILAPPYPGRAFSLLVQVHEGRDLGGLFQKSDLLVASDAQIAELNAMGERVTEWCRAQVDDGFKLRPLEEVMAMALELRSRLAFRLSTEQTLSLFAESLELVRMPGFEDTISLAASCLSVIVRTVPLLEGDAASAAIVELLNLPFPTLDSRSVGTRHWREPVKLLVDRGFSLPRTTAVSAAVRGLIRGLDVSDNEGLFWTLYRLMPFVSSRVIEEDESRVVSLALSRYGGGSNLRDLLVDMGFLPHALHLLPAPFGDSDRTREFFEFILQDRAATKDLRDAGQQFLLISNVLHNSDMRTPERVENLLARILEWQEEVDAHPYMDDEALQNLAELLTYEILPTLSTASEVAIKVIQKLEARGAVARMVDFQAFRLGLRTEREALRSIEMTLRDPETATEGLGAAHAWLRAASVPHFRLLDQTIDGLHRFGSRTLLSCLNSLRGLMVLRPEVLDEQHRDRLASALAQLLARLELKPRQTQGVTDDFLWTPDLRVATTYALSQWRAAWGSHPDVEKALAECTHDMDPEVRLAALECTSKTEANAVIAKNEPTASPSAP